MKDFTASIKTIRTLHSEIQKTERRNVKSAIRIGKILTKLKLQPEVGSHGKWLPWLKDNVNFSDQTARNYIWLYDHRDDPQIQNALNLADAYRLKNGADREPEPERNRAVIPDREEPEPETCEDPIDPFVKSTPEPQSQSEPDTEPESSKPESNPEPSSKPDFAAILKRLIKGIVEAYSSLGTKERAQLLHGLSDALATLKEEA